MQTLPTLIIYSIIAISLAIIALAIISHFTKYNPLKYLVENVYAFYRFFNTNRVLNILQINNNNIQITKRNKLYAIKLESSSNQKLTLSNINDIKKKYSTDDATSITIFYLKIKSYQAIYIYSFNKDIITSIADTFQIKLLNGNQIFKSLSDIFGINEYYIDDFTYQQDTIIDYNQKINIDFFNSSFKKFVKEFAYSSYKNKYIYEATSIGINKTIDTENFFKSNFNGYLSLSINFSDKNIKKTARKIISQINIQTDEYKEEQSEIYNELNSNQKNLALINAYAVVDNDNFVKYAKTYLNIQFKIKNHNTDQLLLKTPIIYREQLFIKLIPLNIIQEFISTTHKKTFDLSSKEVQKGFKLHPDTYGIDRTYNHITYTLDEDSNPHFIIIAKSRSGKSVFLQVLIKNLLRLNIKTFIAQNIDNINIVYSDVGFSAASLFSKLENQYPQNVAILDNQLDSIRFGLFDIPLDKFHDLDETEFLFSIKTIELLLQTNNYQDCYIRGDEEQHIKKALKYIINAKEYTNPTFENLKQWGYENIVEELKAKGYYGEYGGDISITIKDVHEEEYNFLKVPIVKDIISHLEIKSVSQNESETDKAVIKAIIQKLKLIDSIPQFKYYNKRGKLSNKNIVYMEWNNIKENEKLFLPIFFQTQKRIYDYYKNESINNSTKGKPTKPTYFINEEVANITRNPAAKTLIEIFTLESAKYGVHMGYIAQSLSHLTDNIKENVGNTIILPASANKNDQIKDLIANGFKDEEIEVFKQAEQYQACIKNENGTILLKHQLTKDEEMLFNSTR